MAMNSEGGAKDSEIDTSMSEMSLMDFEDHRKNQMGVLQNYVAELTEQNEILIQTIEGLERDHNHKIASLENRLRKCTLSLKEKSNECDVLRRTVDNYKAMKGGSQTHLHSMEGEVTRMGDESFQNQTHIGNLENDIDKLISLIRKARTTGKWELSSLDLKSIPLEDILAIETVVDPLPRSGTEVITEYHIDELREQLKARDKTITRLQLELNQKTKEYHSIIDQASHCDELIDSVKSDVLELERSRQDDTGNIVQQDVHLRQVRKQLIISEEKVGNLQNKVALMEEEINELKEGNDILQSSLDMRLIEIKHKDETIAVLEKKIISAKECMYGESLRTHENEDLHFQLELVNTKLANLQQYIDDLERNREQLTLQLTEAVKQLQLEVQVGKDKLVESESKLSLLNSQLTKEKNRASDLECQLNTRMLDDDVTHRRDIEQREKTMKLLEGQVKRLEEQQVDCENKMMLKDKGMERLQNQQKEYMDEIMKRDNTVHSLELKQLQIEDEHRKAKNEVERLEKDNRARISELLSLKEQHSKVVAEKGKLEAQVKAFKISQQTETDTLSGEVSKQEEYIRNLLFEKTKFEEENVKVNEEMENYVSQVNDLEVVKKDLQKQLQMKDTDLINIESKVQEMKFGKLKDTNKIEELEDEIREMMLKLSSTATQKEQEAHRALLSEEQCKELQHEIDTLIGEISSLSKELAVKKNIEEQLSNEVDQLQRVFDDKDIANKQLHDEIKKVEHQNTLLSYEVSSVKRDVSEDVSSRDHKIMMLEGDLEIANERYTQVNEELTAAEGEVQSLSKKYREISDMTEQLRKQLKQSTDDVQHLEMNLAVTSEKHQTSVKENAHKDATIVKLQSQLDTNQQELEFSTEDLRQTSEQLEQISKLLDASQDKCQTLQYDREEDAKKIQGYIDEINSFQLENVSLAGQLKETVETVTKLEKEMTEHQEIYENKICDLQKNSSEAMEAATTLKTENSSLKYQNKCLDDKNIELSKARTKEGEEKQVALFKYEDLVERYEEYKNEKEGEVSKLTEKVSGLEKELHAAVLNVSQLDGQLKLSDEKLKHSESQLIDEQKSCHTLTNTVESLEQRTLEQDGVIQVKIDQIEELEKASIDAQSELNQKANEIKRMSSDLDAYKESMNTLTMQNKSHLENNADLRDKLSAKGKETDQLNGVISQLESEYKTLEGIHGRTQNELQSSEKSNEQLTEEMHHLRNTVAENSITIQMLQGEKNDLTSKLEVVVVERTTANNKVLKLESKFVTLKESLETDNSALLEENCVLKQEIRDKEQRLMQDLSDKTERIEMFEAAMQEKVKQNTLLEEKIRQASSVVEDSELELNQKTEELFNSEETINELHLQLQQFLEERKTFVADTAKLTTECNQLRSELSDCRHNYKESAQQLAHFQEKCTLIERNLAVTQEQLSARIAANMKQEKLIRRTQSENKHTSDDRKAKEVQIIQYEHFLDETRDELEKVKEDNQKLIEENEAQKSALITYEDQLDQSQKQTEQLLLDVENQKKIIASSSETISSYQEKIRINEIDHETQLQELEENKHLLALACEREEELQRRIRDSESSNQQLQTELDSFLQKNRACQEQISTLDAELRVLRADLHAAQKKCSQQEKYISKSNHQTDKHQSAMQDLKESCGQLKDEMLEKDKAFEGLHNEFQTLQGNLEESMQQLTAKSNELSTVRSDLLAVQRLHTQSEQQLSIVDGKNKKLKTELRRSLDRIKTSADEIVQLTKTVTVLKAELQQLSQQQRISDEDIVRKDEETVALKVEIASLEERFKIEDQDNDALKNEILALNQKHHHSLEELERTKVELEEVKANCERLTRESELAVENMSNWVKEQREGNEKIATKVSEQNEQSASLEAANMRLKEENEKLMAKVKKLKFNLEEKMKESEHHKKFQSENVHKRVLNEQLKSNNEELEAIIEKERRENKENSDEYQGRIKTYVETIQQLHRQLSELNKENLRQRSLLEKQTLSRKNLQAQLKSKENDITLLKDDFNKSEGVNNSQSSPSRHGKANKLSVSSMLDKELERAGVTSEEALDKSYWIQRVAELSVQLQQSSDYWMQKLNTASQISGSYR